MKPSIRTVVPLFALLAGFGMGIGYNVATGSSKSITEAQVEKETPMPPAHETPGKASYVPAPAKGGPSSAASEHPSESAIFHHTSTPSASQQDQPSPSGPAVAKAEDAAAAPQEQEPITIIRGSLTNTTSIGN